MPVGCSSSLKKQNGCGFSGEIYPNIVFCTATTARCKVGYVIGVVFSVEVGQVVFDLNGHCSMVVVVVVAAAAAAAAAAATIPERF